MFNKTIKQDFEEAEKINKKLILENSKLKKNKGLNE